MKQPTGQMKSGLAPGLAVAGIVLVALLAAALRLLPIIPEARALDWLPFADEGVYALATQLALQGYLPYRDFFFAHPGLAPYLYLPALAYHFTAWGSPFSFAAARYLSVAYGTATAGTLGLVGWRLGGPVAGVGAALLWAVDGRALTFNRAVLLDSPVMLLMALALLLYVVSRDATRWRYAGLIAAGALAGLAGLGKSSGLVVAIALLADALLARRLRTAAAVGAGVAATLAAGTAGFVALAGPVYLRDVYLFQLLRPADGLQDPLERLMDLLAAPSVVLTTALAAAGILWGLTTLRRTETRRWAVAALWAAIGTASVLAGRVYFEHYYLVIVPALCLLGGAALAAGARALAGERRGLPPAPGGMHPAGPFRPARMVALLGLAVAVVLGQIQLAHTPFTHSDRLYPIVSRFLSDLPPGKTVLASDPRFTFEAAREPARGPDGTFVVDGLGWLLARGLEIGGTPRPAAAGASVWQVMQRDDAQQALRDRFAAADYVVVHAPAFATVGDETQAWLRDHATAVEQQDRYVIYRIDR